MVTQKYPENRQNSSKWIQYDIKIDIKTWNYIVSVLLYYIQIASLEMWEKLALIITIEVKYNL